MENKKNGEVFHLSKSGRFEDKRFSVPFKTRSFKDTEIKKISVPFKSRRFEGYKTGSFESYQRP